MLADCDSSFLSDCDSALLAVSKTLEGKDRAKVKAFVAAVKALADKIDEL